MPSKEKISITLNPTQVGEISDLVGDKYESRSEAVRTLIDKGLQYEERVGELETERDRLQRQLAATNQRVDEHQELVEYVEQQREVERYRDRRRRRLDEANILTRTKWKLTGMPDAGDDME